MVQCRRNQKTAAPVTTEMLTSQRIHPPQEPTYSGEVAAGYIKGCMSFALGATVTIVVAVLDIITDWNMYTVILENNIPDKVETYTARTIHDDAENDVIWTLRGVYVHLPDIMQGVLIVGSLLFCIYFWWLCYMLLEERKKFKDKRDGLPHKEKIFERYGGEVLLFLHVLCEDLPVSVILLIAQISCSCTFLLNFDDLGYIIATCTTALSLTWKLVQVAWNFGCFNFRQNYLCSSGLVILRIVLLFTISFTWALTAINFVLLRAGKYGEVFSRSTFDTSVFDKIGVDRYIRHQYIVFSQRGNFQYITGSNSWNISQLSEHNNKLTITPIKHIVDAMDRAYDVTLPCRSSATNVSFIQFFKQLHRDSANQTNCSVTFQFSLHSFSKEIHYDARYSFSNNTEECVSDALQIHSLFVKSTSQDSEEALTTELPYLSTASGGDLGSSQTSNIISSRVGGGNSAQDDAPVTNQQFSEGYHTQHPVNYLSFMSSVSSNKYKNCNFHLVPNNTMLSESDVCLKSS